MSEIRGLLERKAGAIKPSPDAFSRVLAVVRRRRRQRVAAIVTSVTLVAGGLAGTAVLVRRQPSRSIVVTAQLVGSRRALELRTELGIRGQTKGAPPAVVVSTKNKSGGANLSLVQIQTGETTPLPQSAGAADGSVSPKGDVVAAVKDSQLVLTQTKSRAGDKPVVVPDATGTTSSVSWDRNGSGLFAPVGGRWVRVSDPAGNDAHPQVEELQVPSIPGGPILLSVSPRGDQVLLFGITYGPQLTAEPHLYLGGFDGTTVSDAHPVDVPDEALAGPLGWVGDNAFLLSSGPGRALIVRTDDLSTIPIQAEPMADPCTLGSAGTPCTPDGPWLLGTNGDGSLLLWQVTGTTSAATPTSGGGQPTGQLVLVLYYKTWLDGTHAVRLTGEVGRYGPPVAAR